MSITFLFVLEMDIVSGVTLREKASLLSFKMSVVSDPEHVLRNWNSSGVNVCEWRGVRCDEARNSVVELTLAGRSLEGTISPALGGLSSLRVLDLSNNYFEGHVPAELGSLPRLEELSLAWNLLQGTIPAEFGSLRQLVYVDIGNNRLSGDIPVGFFCNGSSHLQYVDLSNNSFSGEIPLNGECEMKDLRYLLLWSNRLTGRVPSVLANSTRLEWLDLASNMLNGELPAHVVCQMPHLQFLYLSYNQFTSHADSNLKMFFDALSNSSGLQELELSANNLRGDIPSSIGHLPKTLEQIHLAENQLHGLIPLQISNLINLTLLNLSSNLLNGTIPTTLCQMGRLERVYLSNNSFSGEIPSALGGLPRLGLLDLSQNRLSGSIPDSFANLSQLRRLLLHRNQLSGTIPPSLGECMNLEILDLSYNRISGAVPVEFAGLQSLKVYLNFSHNDLGGELPMELSRMDMVLAVDLSSNHFSGAIPMQIGSCIALEYLNLSSNLLEGSLPDSLGLLPNLRALDVSYNHIVGLIPHTFLGSSTLKTINFSFNDFSGEVSDDGAFSNLTVDSFLGNEGLCGLIKGMRTCRKWRYFHLVIVLILLFLAIMFTITFCLCGRPFTSRSKITRKLSVLSRGDMEDDDEEQEKLEHTTYPKITHEELLEATGGFTPSNLIGSGHFGHVYRGVLRDNTRIAVKVLDSESAREIPQSFKRECQILRRTRHRNLIRIITICSKPDFKALVFPLMSKGSLETYLHPSEGLPSKLDLMQLVSICSDVAEAVAYLHHHSPVGVVHCDLKPSNILLDDYMKALVTDFGISKLLKGEEESAAYISALNSISVDSTNGLLCGSFGYIAPEYGTGERASTQGDVYSFGVLILEIVTGLRPTDPLINHGSSLHEWAKRHLDDIIEQAKDRYCSSSPLAMPEYMPVEHVQRDVLVELINLGLICTQFSPSMRPTMLDVAQEMGRLREYLSSEMVVLPYK
ncbi:hypothetical protein MLD38_006707 [Melastoma candidum]|uniref:Uncharacterized protein n=1 Tax=Melastoma candidum TaxID=119954 RepID=A0ACB9RNV9_9MYRT|nr:hypothetical protein MLD38_006707 [Melastoma candidum]